MQTSRSTRFTVAFCAMFVLSFHPSNRSVMGFEPNYDESKIPEYTLPDPLVTQSGSPVTTAEQWNTVRRPELLALFEKHVYGVSPPPCPIRRKHVSSKTVFDGLATRTEIDVLFGSADDATSMRMMVYVPKQRAGAVPAFLGLNFQGNHGVDDDPEIELNPGWFRVGRDGTTDGNKANEKSRGATASRWPLQMILKRGYAVATLYYGDIDPDFDDGFNNGIHGTLGDQVAHVAPESRWGSIAAWAYGLSRGLDCLEAETDLGIDAAKVAVLGHSRLGKTALWAGATDPRFAMVISNNSGCGGAALSRRAIGETVGRINEAFPHWFCDQFTQYNENEDACPVDQHELIALAAPRPIYVASATEDQWADPKGEFLAAAAADPIYRLLGTDGMGGDAPPAKMPAAEQPINSGVIGYHLRTGKHAVTDYDWQQYLDFADRHLKDGR
ncbi:acetylxylan esterase [Stieleria sp.]|uniref:glucuronyl esterase domain-containing protein n=1 Tax=Stieleria sp. TaxID=2795976 RepID=UPI003563987B